MRGELFGVVAVSDISTISGQNNSACDPYGQAAAGNMTKVPKWQADLTNHISCTYDAWNRLVKGQDDADPAVTVAEYRYDGLNHRIVKLVASGANWDRTDSYCNDNWQCLEERKAAGVSTENRDNLAMTVYTQYLWDIRYIDAVLLRWADLNLDGDFGESDEVLYYAQDANFNTTMVVRPDGSRAERYFYDPYGKVAFLTWDGSINSFTTSVVKNEILYCGYRFDPETGLYHVRNRMYQPWLGRWLQRDRLGYLDGINLYEYCRSGPAGADDPFGTWGFWGWCRCVAGFGVGIGSEAWGVVKAVVGGAVDFVKHPVQTVKDAYSGITELVNEIKNAEDGWVGADIVIKQILPKGHELARVNNTGELDDSPYNKCKLTGEYYTEIAGIVVGAAGAAKGAKEIAKLIRKKIAKEVFPARIRRALATLRDGKNHKVVSSDADLQRLYNTLSADGKPATPPTYDGTMVELPDGSTVGLRNKSSSGGRTIELTFSDGTERKVHIQP